MSLIVSVDHPRLHVLLIGTGRYMTEEWNRIADGISAEIKEARDLFIRKLEYDDCREIGPYTDRALGVKVQEWAREQALSSEDRMVVYYTGHGSVDEDGGPLRLITSDIDAGDERTAIPATDFVDWLRGVKADILLIVDTCYSGALAVDALAMQQRALTPRDHMRFLTSASPIETARPCWLVHALSLAVDKLPSSTVWLPMEEVMDRVNKELATCSLDVRLESIRSKALEQSLAPAIIECSLEREREVHARSPKSSQIARFSGAIEGLSRFFPNRGRLELTKKMGKEEALWVLHSIQRDAFRNHWDPRARGVAVGAEDGWFFAGRLNALAKLKAMVSAPSRDRMTIVSGMPGSGKSAVLARFVTLADPEQRQRAEVAGALVTSPAATLPEPDCVDVAVHARARSVTSIAMEIATICGASLDDGDWDDPFAALAVVLATEKQRCRVVVVDAVDEAEDPLKLAFFLRRLAAEPSCSVCVIAGVRTDAAGPNSVVSRFGDNVDALNLDRDEFWDQADIAAFVERFLRTQTGSPYRSLPDPDYAAQVAKAVAARSGRSFLVAATTARSLAGRGEPIAHEELENLPTDAGEAFDLDLKRFGSEWRQGLTVLGALAFSRGRGLPLDIWSLVAAAIDPGITTSDVDYWGKSAAGFYVVREQVGGEEVCRLYHEAFVQHLKQKLDGEHVARNNPACLHGSLSACVAMALLAYAQQEPPVEQVSRHVLDHLAGYLADAHLRDPLVHLVSSSSWINTKKRGNPDPTRLLSDFSKAIAAVRSDPLDLQTFVRLCAMKSLQVTPRSTVVLFGVSGASVEAPSIVIDTLARAGQLGRARLLADNVLFPLDRCHAHALLAQHLHEQGAHEDALSCLAEAKRTVTAIRTDFKSMGYFWITRAANSIGQDQEARAAANLALASIPKPKGNEKTGTNGTLHAALWTGLCFRELHDKDSLAKLRKRLIRIYRPASLHGYCNLSIQAAAVVNDRAFLRQALAARLDGDGFLKPGNVEFALATAGMDDEWNRLEHGLRERGKWPGEQDPLWYSDSGKRFVWALAFKGRYEEALRIVHQIGQLEERARALYRVSECAARPLTPDLQRRLGESADRILSDTFSESEAKSQRHASQISSRNPKPRETTTKRAAFLTGTVAPWRIQSWLAPVYLTAGLPGRAVDLCDKVCNSNLVLSSDTSLCQSVLETRRAKSHVSLRIDPTEDEKCFRDLQDSLAKNSLADAKKLLDDIHSRRLQARGAIAIALRLPDPGRAIEMMLDALEKASLGGINELKYVLYQGKEVIARACPDGSVEVLNAVLRDTVAQHCAS